MTLFDACVCVYMQGHLTVQVSRSQMESYYQTCLEKHHRELQVHFLAIKRVFSWGWRLVVVSCFSLQSLSMLTLRA